MKVETSFENGENIPERFTCDGKDVSPPLELKKLSKETNYIAVVVDDPDAPGGTFDHWLIWNIPVENKEIPGKLPQKKSLSELGGAKQGRNDFGEIGYRGPCPPGETHEYRFKFYGLMEPLDLAPGSSKSELEKAMKREVTESFEIKGIYGR